MVQGMLARTLKFNECWNKTIKEENTVRFIKVQRLWWFGDVYRNEDKEIKKNGKWVETRSEEKEQAKGKMQWLNYDGQTEGWREGTD